MLLRTAILVAALVTAAGAAPDAKKAEALYRKAISDGWEDAKRLELVKSIRKDFNDDQALLRVVDVHELVLEVGDFMAWLWIRSALVDGNNECVKQAREFSAGGSYQQAALAKARKFESLLTAIEKPNVISRVWKLLGQRVKLTLPPMKQVTMAQRQTLGEWKDGGSLGMPIESDVKALYQGLRAIKRCAAALDHNEDAATVVCRIAANLDQLAKNGILDATAVAAVRQKYRTALEAELKRRDSYDEGRFEIQAALKALKE